MSIRNRLKRLERSLELPGGRCPDCPPPPPIVFVNEGEEIPPPVVCQTCGRPANEPGRIRVIEIAHAERDPEPDTEPLPLMQILGET
jgi:hypothetical protein